MQQVAPYNAYPTPPPASSTFQSTSSSLAGALGPMDVQPRQREERKPMQQYNPSESKSFFNKFLSDKVKELPKPKPQPRQTIFNNPPLPSSPLAAQSSPDPLLKSVTASPLTPINASQFTPKKRKMIEVLIESPTKKIATSPSPFSSQLTPLPPSSPRTPQTSTSSTIMKSENANTFPKPRMQVVVELSTPSRNWSSPQSQRRMQSSDLGGYGSEDELEYAKRREMLLNGRSPGKKTGERDERGMYHVHVATRLSIFTSIISSPRKIH